MGVTNVKNCNERKPKDCDNMHKKKLYLFLSLFIFFIYLFVVVFFQQIIFLETSSFRFRRIRLCDFDMYIFGEQILCKKFNSTWRLAGIYRYSIFTLPCKQHYTTGKWDYRKCTLCVYLSKNLTSKRVKNESLFKF